MATIQQTMSDGGWEHYAAINATQIDVNVGNVRVIGGASAQARQIAVLFFRRLINVVPEPMPNPPVEPSNGRLRLTTGEG